MARLRGRARKGARLRAGIPNGHWKTTTFVAGLRLDGIAAPMVLDGPINRDAFQAYVDQVLGPELSPGDIVIMDNLGSHKGPAVRRAIEAAGASLLYLPLSAPTSTRSRTPSPTSRRFCARRRPELSALSGTRSALSSTCSPQPSAPTTSEPQDTNRIKLKPL
jgi:hypothetical protein